jgi:hypothetical protein
MQNSLHNKIWYSTLAFFAVSIIGVFFYLYNDAYATKKEIVKIKEYSLDSKNTITKNDWMNMLSSKITQENYLPVSQINIQLDKIDGYADTKKIYSIIMRDIDEYKFFCAKQVLDSFNRPYSFVKRDSELSVSLILEKKSMYEQIIYELKNYEIDTKVVSKK